MPIRDYFEHPYTDENMEEHDLKITLEEDYKGVYTVNVMEGSNIICSSGLYTHSNADKIFFIVCEMIQESGDLDPIEEFLDNCHAAQGETIVILDDQFTLRSNASKDRGVTCGEYIRICDPLGYEVKYWEAEEWKADPITTMNDIMCSLA